MIDDDDIF